MYRFFKTVSDFVKEYHYGFIYPFSALLSLFYQPKWYRSPKATKGTIIMVFCWFTPNISHNKWVTYLEKKGYRTYLLSLPLLFEDFQSTALRLKQFIGEHKLKNYTLVGISTGAVVCLYFLKRYKKWNEVHTFINVGGPMHGSPTARYISFIGKGRDILPGSKFVKSLEETHIPPGKMVTFTSTYDELVPQSYSLMKGNTLYTLPVWGHNMLHFGSRQTYDLIAKIAGDGGV